MRNKEIDLFGSMWAILTDLTSVCSCLPRDLVVTTLEVYGHDKESLHSVSELLSLQKKKMKIGSVFMHWVNAIRKKSARPCIFLLTTFFF